MESLPTQEAPMSSSMCDTHHRLDNSADKARLPCKLQLSENTCGTSWWWWVGKGEEGENAERKKNWRSSGTVESQCDGPEVEGV